MLGIQLLEDYEEGRISKAYYEITEGTIWFWKTYNKCTMQWRGYRKTLESGSLHTFNVKYPITLRIGKEEVTAPVEIFYQTMSTFNLQ